MKTALAEPFGRMGLEIVDFEVIEVALPAEFKAAISQATLVQHTGRAKVLEAQSLAQVTQIESLAAAQAQLSTGMAQVQLMAQLQAQGIDPLKYEALKALNTMAANPSQAASVVSGDAARAQLFSQVAVAALTPGAPAQPLMPVAQVVDQPPAPAPAALPPGAPATRQDLELQLDALIQRLAEGKISEETYKSLSARLEAKLKQLGPA